MHSRTNMIMHTTVDKLYNSLLKQIFNFTENRKMSSVYFIHAQRYLHISI